jgi:hypothetical protein
MTTVLERLKETTYVVEHSPRCPKPYLVRLVGAEKGCIDKLPRWKTADALGYGQTLDEAAEKAFEAQERQVAVYRERLVRATAQV